jgi:hypothetical protein
VTTVSLPTLVGPTENALRSLLQRILAATQITGYVEWVYLNVRDSSDADAQVDELVADALKQPISDVLAARQRLAAEGLIDAAGALTSLGQDQLLHGRALVGAATKKLTEGIPRAQLEVTAEVLETVRRRAQAELSD